MQWSVGRVIKTIFETRNLTSPREKMIMGLDERKKKERGGKKKDKIVAECRHELSSDRRIRLSRPLYPTKLSAEAERRALLRPRKLYRGSEVADERGRELS